LAVFLLHEDEGTAAAEAAVEVFGVEEGCGEGAVEGYAGEGDEASAADAALFFAEAHVGVEVVFVPGGDEFVGVWEVEGGGEEVGVEGVEVQLVAELGGEGLEGVGGEWGSAGDGVVEDGKLAGGAAEFVGVLEEALGEVGGVDGVLLGLGLALAEVVVGVGGEDEEADDGGYDEGGFVPGFVVAVHGGKDTWGGRLKCPRCGRLVWRGEPVLRCRVACAAGPGVYL